jgi:hypothetical protein
VVRKVLSWVIFSAYLNLQLKSTYARFILIVYSESSLEGLSEGCVLIDFFHYILYTAYFGIVGAAVIFFVVHSSEPAVQEVEFKVSTCKKHQGLTPLLKSEVHPRKREGSAVIINPLTLEEGQKGD